MNLFSAIALPLFTAVLAGAAFLQMRQTNANEKLRFDFELFRLAQAQAPIVVADFKRDIAPVILLRNAGTGPAVNVRFSGLVNFNSNPPRQEEYSAAQRGVSAIGVGQAVELIRQDHLTSINELLIRYDDVFGNVYSTEYRAFSLDGGWYTWRKPVLSKRFDQRSIDCSEDDPAWGFRSRKYYDALKGLW